MATTTPAGTKRRLREPERRKLILAAARDVLACNGPDAASMGEIAERAGVTRSVLYDHFASKDAILRAVLEEHHRALMAALDSAAGKDVLDESGFRELVTRSFNQADADPTGWRILCLERSADPALAAYQRETGRELDDWLAARIAAGRPPAERRALARALRAAINELVAIRQENPRAPRQRLVELAVGFFRGVQ